MNSVPTNLSCKPPPSVDYWPGGTSFDYYHRSGSTTIFETLSKTSWLHSFHPIEATFRMAKVNWPSIAKPLCTRKSAFLERFFFRSEDYQILQPQNFHIKSHCIAYFQNCFYLPLHNLSNSAEMHSSPFFTYILYLISSLTRNYSRMKSSNLCD